MSYIEAGGVKLYYRSINKREVDQPLVVFIHGFNSSTASLNHVASYPKNRFESLIFDLPNHGLSGSIVGLNWGKLREVLIDLFNGLKLADRRIYVVGHSLGAALALLWLELFPKTNKILLVAPLTYYSDFSKQKAEDLKKLLLPTNKDEAKETLNRLIPDSIGGWKGEVERLAPILLKITSERRRELEKLVEEIILNKDFLNDTLKVLYLKHAKRMAIITAERDLFLFEGSIKTIVEGLGIDNLELKGRGHGCFYAAADLFSKIINHLIDGKNLSELRGD